jgi:hypothetical protein
VHRDKDDARIAPGCNARNTNGPHRSDGRFVTPADEPIICDIQQLIGKRLERCTVPGFD